MKIVILDRDGVINYDSPDYIKAPEEWIPIPGSIDAIAKLCKHNVLVYIATNQAGLARHLFTKQALESIHQKLLTAVATAGGKIEKIFFCPHHPDAGCNCRKPKTGLLEAIAEHSQDTLKKACFVGDSLKDLHAAISFGCQPVLVQTGNGINTLGQINAKQQEDILVYTDLSGFVDSYLTLHGLET